MITDRAFTCVEDKKATKMESEEKKKSKERDEKRLQRQNLSIESVSGEELEEEKEPTQDER